MPPEICPGCAQPITPAQWARCVAITRDGARAHLVCLERGLPVPIHTNRADRPWYLLARRTCSAQWLRPGARFQALVGNSVIIAVPMRELLAQCAILDTVHAGQVADLLCYGSFGDLGEARLAAAEEAGLDLPAPDPAVVRGIWGPDDPVPF